MIPLKNRTVAIGFSLPISKTGLRSARLSLCFLDDHCVDLFPTVGITYPGPLGCVQFAFAHDSPIGVSADLHSKCNPFTANILTGLTGSTGWSALGRCETPCTELPGPGERPGALPSCKSRASPLVRRYRQLAERAGFEPAVRLYKRTKD